MYRRTLVVILLDYFGSDFLVLSGNVLANLLVFRSKATSKLRLVQQRDGNNDVKVFLDAVTRYIVSETKHLNPENSIYYRLTSCPWV